MTDPLNWRDAARDDRPALERFACTVPAPRDRRGRHLPHPKPYELEVQRWLHRHKPPGDPEDIFRIAVDRDGDLAAAAVTSQLTAPAGLVFKIRALAIACARRGAGGIIADACMQDSLEAMNRRAISLGEARFLVSGLVHVSNTPSQRMCQRNRFTCVGPDADGYEQWLALIETAAP